MRSTLCLAAALTWSSLASAATVEVSGTITDSLEGEPLERALIKVPGSARARSDEEGAYRLVFDTEAAFEKLVVKKSRHYPRVTWVAGEGVQSRDFDLLPKKGAFDLAQFDLLFRIGWEMVEGVETSPRYQSTFRWTTRPRFVVASRFVDCSPSGLEEECGFAEEIPEDVYRRVKRLVRRNAPLLSGGFVARPEIGRRSVEQGRAYPRSDSSLLREGEVLIVLGDFSGMAWARLRDAGVMTAAGINARVLEGRALDERSLIHELAHSLGFSHPLGYRVFPRPTIMGNCDQDPDIPSDDDVLHAYVLYQRPPGSATPDRDPRPEGLESKKSRSGWGSKFWSGCGGDRPTRPLERLEPKGSETLVTGELSSGDAPCAGSLGKPCRLHALTVEQAGEATLTLSWSEPGVDLDFQLFRAGSPLALSHRRNGCNLSRPAGRQRDRFAVEPGVYELRVIQWAGKGSVEYELSGSLP